MIGVRPDFTGLKQRQALYVGLDLETRLFVCEGTIRSSKTITAIEIFIQRVNKSIERNHLIACKDYDAINRNILDSNGLGLLKRYPNLCHLQKDKIKRAVHRPFLFVLFFLCSSGELQFIYHCIAVIQPKLLFSDKIQKSGGCGISVYTIHCFIVSEKVGGKIFLPHSYTVCQAVILRYVHSKGNG